MKKFFSSEIVEATVPSQSKEMLRVYLSLTAFSALLVFIHIATEVIIKNLGLHIPGLSGITWMPLLLIGKIKYRTKISATYMAAVSSALVLWVTPMIGVGKIGGMWLLPFLRYGIPGAVLDILWPFTEKFLNKSFIYPFTIVLVTALAHTCKVPFSILTWHFGFGHYVSTHFTLATIILLYFVLGAAGGVIGSLIGYSRSNNKNLRND